ncbi:hypothetical protein [Candidatus Hydrogenosomobacter endosymbioticus]|uniref:Uncharacterized protein n=1 Tax=Candidatus Hydrogenosomobacter endosymbioticus TaxID=2558174 RepID=A0ABM7V9V5_9PROT|nr:hypothetical protein [Candidatus Hydrogenosomobacter endosymbioticus]BDB96248.1 hypothetical protein HYD_3810 [Candidatus Hydrogenosomobacter endosymbioticus]
MKYNKILLISALILSSNAFAGKDDEKNKAAENRKNKAAEDRKNEAAENRQKVQELAKQQRLQAVLQLQQKQELERKQKQKQERKQKLELERKQKLELQNQTAGSAQIKQTEDAKQPQLTMQQMEKTHAPTQSLQSQESLIEPSLTASRIKVKEQNLKSSQEENKRLAQKIVKTLQPLSAISPKQSRSNSPKEARSEFPHKTEDQKIEARSIVQEKIIAKIPTIIESTLTGNIKQVQKKLAFENIFKALIQRVNPASNTLTIEIPGSNEEQVNKEQVNKEQVNKEQVNKEPINKEQINEEQINKEQINKEQINKEQINKEQINKKSNNKNLIIKNVLSNSINAGGIQQNSLRSLVTLTNNIYEHLSSIIRSNKIDPRFQTKINVDAKILSSQVDSILPAYEKGAELTNKKSQIGRKQHTEIDTQLKQTPVDNIEKQATTTNTKQQLEQLAAVDDARDASQYLEEEKSAPEQHLSDQESSTKPQEQTTTKQNKQIKLIAENLDPTNQQQVKATTSAKKAPQQLSSENKTNKPQNIRDFLKQQKSAKKSDLQIQISENKKEMTDKQKAAFIELSKELNKNTEFDNTANQNYKSKQQEEQAIKNKVEKENLLAQDELAADKSTQTQQDLIQQPAATSKQPFSDEGFEEYVDQANPNESNLLYSKIQAQNPAQKSGVKQAPTIPQEQKKIEQLQSYADELDKFALKAQIPATGYINKFKLPHKGLSNEDKYKMWEKIATSENIKSNLKNHWKSIKDALSQGDDSSMLAIDQQKDEYVEDIYSLKEKLHPVLASIGRATDPASPQEIDSIKTRKFANFFKNQAEFIKERLAPKNKNKTENELLEKAYEEFSKILPKEWAMAKDLVIENKNKDPKEQNAQNLTAAKSNKKQQSQEKALGTKDREENPLESSEESYDNKHLSEQNRLQQQYAQTMMQQQQLFNPYFMMPVQYAQNHHPYIDEIENLKRKIKKLKKYKAANRQNKGQIKEKQFIDYDSDYQGDSESSSPQIQPKTQKPIYKDASSQSTESKQSNKETESGKTSDKTKTDSPSQQPPAKKLTEAQIIKQKQEALNKNSWFF